MVLERAASVANIAMLRANDLPSQIQIEKIEELTTLLYLELDTLTSDDTSPETRNRILAQLDINRSIVAPIRRLPKELLIDIFFLLAYESPLRTLHVAATIARVCIVWRDIAHGLTDFWTKAVVNSARDLKGYCELFLPLTEEKLSDLRCDNREALGSLWDYIEPHASRWRRITLGARLSEIPDLKVIYMERLERLIVDAYDTPVSAELSALDFVVAPNLRHIGLTIDVLQSERQLHIPAMRALTSLTVEAMESFPATRVLPLLRECAQTLQFLTLKIRHPSDRPEGSSPTSASNIFRMTALSELRVNDSACALLNYIIAPFIIELILSTVPAKGSQWLLGFLTRNQESRHLLGFRVYQTEERDISAWIPCLELIPSVIDLHFDELLSNEDFLKLLIRHADIPPILPSLKRIAIANIYKKHKELQQLIREMCKSRAKVTTYQGRLAVMTLSWFVERMGPEWVGREL
ncbi:hypothetical protein GGG16DRAFT_56166 [Schizophyllum commune]